MDVTALFKLGYGLYVIGTEVDGQLSGCTANSVMQITSDPVQIVVGLNKANYTNEMIHKSGKLTVSILDKSAEMDLIANFGFQSSRTADKFHTSGQPFVVDGQQVPYLSEHTSAVLSAKVVNTSIPIKPFSIWTALLCISLASSMSNINSPFLSKGNF